MLASARFDSPLGALTIWQEGDAVTRLDWSNVGGAPETDLLVDAVAQLEAYFSGTRQAFDLPFDVQASQFQRDVCAAMLAIPYGDTRTYGAIAKDLGVPAQAIGQACGANPIPIMIPCHRVLGATSLGGFSGREGIESKVALLRLEGAAGLLI